MGLWKVWLTWHLNFVITRSSTDVMLLQEHRVYIHVVLLSGKEHLLDHYTSDEPVWLWSKWRDAGSEDDCNRREH